MGLRRPRTIPGTGRPSPYGRPITGCLVTAAALVVPRLVLGAVWVLSDRVTEAFDAVLVPFIGLLLFPLATAAFAFTRDAIGPVDPGTIAVAVAVGIVDAVLLAVGLFGAVRERLE